jgi:hypothetical protein
MSSSSSADDVQVRRSVCVKLQYGPVEGRTSMQECLAHSRWSLGRSRVADSCSGTDGSSVAGL